MPRHWLHSWLYTCGPSVDELGGYGPSNRRTEFRVSQCSSECCPCHLSAHEPVELLFAPSDEIHGIGSRVPSGPRPFLEKICFLKHVLDAFMQGVDVDDDARQVVRKALKEDEQAERRQARDAKIPLESSCGHSPTQLEDSAMRRITGCAPLRIEQGCAITIARPGVSLTPGTTIPWNTSPVRIGLKGSTSAPRARYSSSASAGTVRPVTLRTLGAPDADLTIGGHEGLERAEAVLAPPWLELVEDVLGGGDPARCVFEN